jgi:hypothetical protein
MKRLRNVACCVVVLALSAGVASASAAGTPEWFECLKNKAGKLEKGCGKEGGKGGYEARPGFGGSSAFAANGGSTLLKTVGGHELTCSGFNLEGERVLPDLLRNIKLSR